MLVECHIGPRPEHHRTTREALVASRSADALDLQIQAAARQICRGIPKERVASLLGAVAHPKRIQIMAELLGGDTTHRSLTRSTRLKAGPLYYHLRELRSARLIGPKVRDIYSLTPRGRRVLLGVLVLGELGLKR
jgi:hypothetical protein